MEMNRQQPQQRFAAPPVPDTGLYSFANEHDACGVGLVADLNNVPSHRIVGMGMTVLKRLMHRGAAGGDPDTGDGVVVLTSGADGAEDEHGIYAICGEIAQAAYAAIEEDT